MSKRTYEWFKRRLWGRSIKRTRPILTSKRISTCSTWSKSTYSPWATSAHTKHSKIRGRTLRRGCSLTSHNLVGKLTKTRSCRLSTRETDNNFSNWQASTLPMLMNLVSDLSLSSTYISAFTISTPT